MGLAEQYRAFAAYNHWMNERLYALCATLPDEDRRRDQKAFFGSIHRTLNHLLLADRIWMGRLTGDTSAHASLDAQGIPIQVTGLDQVLYDDFDALKREREATDRAIMAWANDLSEERLAAPMAYRTLGGHDVSHPLWVAATQLFNHQTHHRSQVITLLTQLGHSFGVTDFLQFMRTADR